MCSNKTDKCAGKGYCFTDLKMENITISLGGVQTGKSLLINELVKSGYKVTGSGSCKKHKNTNIASIMKIITYQCNICSDQYPQKEAVLNKSVFACYFTGNKTFELKAIPAETDRHICKNCLESILRSPK